jgi:hypothetical protein
MHICRQSYFHVSLHACSCKGMHMHIMQLLLSMSSYVDSCQHMQDSPGGHHKRVDSLGGGGGKCSELSEVGVVMSS